MKFHDFWDIHSDPADTSKYLGPNQADELNP